jgi:hypothetical protein
LDALLNLVNIAEGNGFHLNPFKRERLPPKKLGAKYRKVQGLSDKAELFKYKKHGKGVYPILHDLFNTHLRNAISHNKYEVMMGESKIHLLEYGEFITFDEFNKLSSDLASFQYMVDKSIIDAYLGDIKPEIKNYGIKDVSLGYADPILLGDKLFPNGMCLSELTIYQFWDFETFENGERYFLIPDLEIDNIRKKLHISFGADSGLCSFHIESEDVKMWLEHVVYHGRINVTLHTIAPMLPHFIEKAQMLLPIKETIYCVLSTHEREVDIPTSVLSDIKKAIGLG